MLYRRDSQNTTAVSPPPRTKRDTKATSHISNFSKRNILGNNADSSINAYNRWKDYLTYSPPNPFHYFFQDDHKAFVSQKAGTHSETLRRSHSLRRALTPWFCRIIAQPSNLVFMTGEVDGCVKICGDSLLLTSEDSISDGLDVLYFLVLLQRLPSVSWQLFWFFVSLFVINPVSHRLLKLHISFCVFTFLQWTHFTFHLGLYPDFFLDHVRLSTILVNDDK